MMLPTHVLAGLAVAAPLVVLLPDLAPAALLGVLVGSILPDLDLYFGHRKTLHYPTGYPLAAVATAGLVVAIPTPVAIALAGLFAGAGLHCRMDRYGGGLELRPWEATSERGVYDHVEGRWLRPRRWIRYDGAPEDLLVAGTIGLPMVILLDGGFQLVAAAALAIAVVYTVLRRHLADLAPTFFGRMPAPARSYVPRRYLE